jgi:hypothetical protein
LPVTSIAPRDRQWVRPEQTVPVNRPAVTVTGPPARPEPAPPADPALIARYLNQQTSRNPRDIKVPSGHSWDRYDRSRWAWEYRERLRSDARRRSDWRWDFWSGFCLRSPRVTVVYNNRPVPVPVYYYSPGYHYWGYDWYDPFRRSTVVVVNQPATRVVETRTEYVVRETPVVSYSAGASSEEPWPGYRDERRDVERAARVIERAWEEADLNALADCLDNDLPVRLYESGDYLYWVGYRQFLERVREDMEERGTRSFTVDRVVPVRPGEAFVFARHQLRESGARSDLRYERYTLERVGERWVISAFEVSFDPIIER